MSGRGPRFFPIGGTPARLVPEFRSLVCTKRLSPESIALRRVRHATGFKERGLTICDHICEGRSDAEDDGMPPRPERAAAIVPVFIVAHSLQMAVPYAPRSRRETGHTIWQRRAILSVDSLSPPEQEYCFLLSG